MLGIVDDRAALLIAMVEHKELNNDENGKGQRATQFSGQCALVSMILMESYDGLK